LEYEVGGGKRISIGGRQIEYDFYGRGKKAEKIMSLALSDSSYLEEESGNE